MKKIGFLTVSLTALMTVGVARAELAAKSYVDDVAKTKANVSDVYTQSQVDSKLGDYATTIALNAVKEKADSAVQPGNLAKVATSGSYNDLTDIPDISATQVQVDWNATTGIESIKNKPTLATVATSGSYDDLENKPSIPSGALASKSSISNADVAADAAIAPTKIAIETSGTYDADMEATEKDKRIPSLLLVTTMSQQIADETVESALEDYPSKDYAVTHTPNTAAGDSTHPVYINKSGVATKIDKVAAASEADAATSASQDASGNVITETYATKEQNTAAVAAASAAQTRANDAYALAGGMIPKPSGSCKDCVLKYNGTEFSWEEIGR